MRLWKNLNIVFCILAFLAVILIGNGLVKADEYTSQNFIVRDPIINIEGGYSTSNSFQYFSSTGQPFSGPSSDSSFSLRSGFLNLPSGTTQIAQNTYRWYENGDGSVQPGPALANENVSAGKVTGGNVLRLRLSVKATGQLEYPKNKIFKLQFAEKGFDASCASLNNNSFVDVGQPGSQIDWLGFDNPNVSDGARISATLLSTSANAGARETYEEYNNSAASPDYIYTGINTDSEWDWVLLYRQSKSGTSYCFRQVFADGTLLDAYNNYPQVLTEVIQTLSITSATSPVTAGTAPSRTGGMSATKGNLLIEGKAPPESRVVLLKDGSLIRRLEASSKGDFSVEIGNLSQGTFNLGLYAIDKQEEQSNILTRSFEISTDKIVKITDLIAPPTIYFNFSAVKHGDPFPISGQTYPNQPVEIVVDSPQNFSIFIKADEKGLYKYSLNSGLFAKGEHEIYVKANQDSISKKIKFRIALETTYKDAKKKLIGDLDGDKHVNIVDFSILAYWYKKELPSEIKQYVDFNYDNLVDLADFSIMASNWTG